VNDTGVWKEDVPVCKYRVAHALVEFSAASAHELGAGISKHFDHSGVSIASTLLCYRMVTFWSEHYSIYIMCRNFTRRISES
jgi:hypothetical protein